MNALRDLIQKDPGFWLANGGLVIGMIFGFLVYRTNFCTMGAISDVVNLDDFRRFRSWILAAAVAIIGTQLLSVTGAVPLSKSMYLSPTLSWFGNIVGGLMFGFGMVFAGGCASRNLARVGGGDLRALMTLLVMGIFAYMTIGGILGPVRSGIEAATSINLRGLNMPTQSIGDMVATMTPLGASTGNMIAALAVVTLALIYCLRDEAFRASPVHILAGIGVGLCAVAGWALTGLAYDEMATRTTNPISLTFVRPTADSVEWLQRFTAGMMPGFGVTTVLGAILGSFIAAVSMRRFRVSTFSDVGDTKRTLLGAAMMGIGGVLAMGCTIGQGVTGISTLALGSFLTFAAIVIGGIRGMKTLETILSNEA
jgi:uncharacterized protein